MTSQPSHGDGAMGHPVHLSDDELSAYVNGEITEARALEQFQTHLDECPECRVRLTEIRTVVSLLNRLEAPAPSRSFKIDSSMVSPRHVAVDPWIVRVQPAMRRLTAIAAALLLIIVVADVVSHQGSGGGSQVSSVEVATMRQTAAGGSAAVAPSSSTSAARDTEATAIPASGALAAPATSATGTPVPPESQQQAVTQSEAEAKVSHSPSAQAGTSYWRLAEFAVGVVVVWLLFLTVALPRLHLRREA